MKRAWFLGLAVIVLSFIIIGCIKSTGKGILPAYNEQNCADSDGGVEKDLLGTVSFMNEKKQDKCISRNMLLEYYCSRNKVRNTTMFCKSGCKKGSCLIQQKNFDSDVCPVVDGIKKDSNIHLIFVPSGFETTTEKEVLQKEIQLILYGNDNSPLLGEKHGFLEIDMIQKYKEVITVHRVEENFNAPKSGGFSDVLVEFSKKKCPFYNEARDVVIYFKNDTTQGGYAYTVLSVQLEPKIIVASPGVGLTFAHEFGHAFAGLNEEYFIPQNYLPEKDILLDNEEQVGYGSTNCDRHTTPCTMWCSEIDEQKYQNYVAALSKEKECRDILEQQDVTAWQNLCPTLNLQSKWDTDKVDSFCKNLLWYATSNWKLSICSYTTTDPLKYVNIGKNCLEGHGCYTGCGGAVNAFRSSPYSIMGCGDIDDCNDVYGYATDGTIIIEPLFPDALPEYSFPGKNELEKQFTLWTST